MMYVPLNTVGWPDWYLWKSSSSYKTASLEDNVHVLVEVALFKQGHWEVWQVYAVHCHQPWKYGPQLVTVWNIAPGVDSFRTEIVLDNIIRWKLSSLPMSVC